MVDFGLLGPLEIRRAGEVLRVRSAQQRRLLAVLLLHRNEVVTRGRLVDALWGERPPKSAVHGLEVQVSRLRKLLGEGRLSGERGGYVLRVEPGELDVDRFRLLAAAGRRRLEQGDAGAAVDLLAEALATVRGRPYGEFEREPFARAEAAALDELRLAVAEDRVAAQLELGRSAELVPELERLIAEAPARERLRGQLMLALYRAGRQTEALAAYRTTRLTLVEEFGLEPSRELQKLERAILEQDPALDVDAVEPPVRTATARRLVTVVSAEHAQTTTDDDPERERQSADRFRTSLVRELERYGGTVERSGSDGVVATFGAPAGQEDHAVRALLGALAAQTAVARLRLGVSSGEVVVTDDEDGRPRSSGTAYRTAALLARAAAPGQTLVAQRTVALSGPQFVFGAPRPISADGGGPFVTALPLRQAAPGERPLGVARLGRTFVGREPELELLKTSYRHLVERREPRVVTVLGDAGVGKTSLVRELMAWVEGQSPSAVLRLGRCRSYGRGDTYGPLASVLRDQLGLDPAATLEQTLARLRGREILALTLGLDAGGALHPLAARERLHEAWVRLFEEIAAERAVVVIEDLHWADEPLVDLLEVAAGEVRAPVLLVVTARPEFAETRGGWPGGVRNSSVISLEPLTPEDAEAMVRGLLDGRPPTGLEQLVDRRAEGNPFFVEELLASLLDAGLLQCRESGWELDATRAESIPDSVRGVIAARFDLLGPDERTALEAAAVVGRSFDEGSVVDLLTDEHPDFALLETRGFVRRLSDRRYVFKHALTREVVYVGLAKPARARLHAAVAEGLEQATETPDEAAALLAHHFGAAVAPEDVDLAWADDRERAAALAVKAVQWLRRAGELATRRFAIDDGLVLLHRALALEPPPDVEGELWRAIGRAHAVRYAGVEAIAAYERAADLMPTADARGEIYAELALETVQRYAMLNPLPPRTVVDDWIERALEHARPGTHARAEALVARALWSADSDDAADEALAIAEELGDVELRSESYNAKALSAFVGRRYDESLEWATKRVGLAEEISDPDHLVDIHSMVIPGLLGRGRFDEARRQAELHDEAASRLSPHHQVHAVAMKLELEELTGRWDLISELAVRASAAVEANVDTPCVRNSRSLLACAVASAELGDDARSRQLEARSTEIAMAGYGAVFAPLRIRLELARGNLGALERLLGEAVPPPPAKNWWALTTEAARLDALAALGDREAVEVEAPQFAVVGTYLEPFALRALGLVREDDRLLEDAHTRFAALGLEWFAARTQR